MVVTHTLLVNRVLGGHTQLLPESTKVESHAIPQLVPSHVACPCPLAGPAHGVHEAPQLCTLELLSQTDPQKWKLGLQCSRQPGCPDRNTQLTVPFAGGTQHCGPHSVVPALHVNWH